ncbi:MAG: hypothetical protein J7K26_03850 [Candidatus Aenigmarchaeota archaeon]|nr:hypothetical protein [Candidatus Aenigmarchaeota archaeon]
MKKILDNYVNGAYCLETFTGNENDVYHILRQYTNKDLVIARIFVYGILRRYGASDEGLNALLPVSQHNIIGPIAVTWKKILFGKNIIITKGGIRRTKYEPGSTTDPGDYLEVFTIIGSKKDVDKFVSDWNNLEISFGYVVAPCTVQVGPPKDKNYLSCSLYLDSESKIPANKTDIIIVVPKKPTEWFILSSKRLNKINEPKIAKPEIIKEEITKEEQVEKKTFYDRIEQELESDKPKLGKMKQILYEKLFNIFTSAGIDQKNAINLCREITQEFTIDLFSELVLAMKTISSRISIDGNIVSEGREVTTSDLINWIIENLDINPKIKDILAEIKTY